MELKARVRNEFGKCQTPEWTIERINPSLQRLGVDFRYSSTTVSVADFEFHSFCISQERMRLFFNGKGTTYDMARAGAHAETVERLSTLGYIDPSERRYQIINSDVYREMHSLGFLPGSRQCHQDDLDDKIALDALFGHQPNFTEEDLDFLKNDWQSQFWSDAYNLSAERQTKIPSLVISEVSRTNGLAAGNTIEEAIVQASCEVFERFAKRTVIAKVPLPSLRPEDFGDQTVRLVSELRNHNIDVYIKDFSLDGLLPVVGVFAFNRNYPMNDIRSQSLFLGADFDLNRALTRCFTEGFQGRSHIHEYGVVKTGKFVDYREIANASDLLYAGTSRYDLSYLATSDCTSLAMGKYEHLRNTRDEIDEIKSICDRLNSELIACDCTVPFFDFPVVRTVIPSVSDVLPYFTLRYNYAQLQKASQDLHDDVRKLFEVLRRKGGACDD